MFSRDVECEKSNIKKENCEFSLALMVYKLFFMTFTGHFSREIKNIESTLHAKSIERMGGFLERRNSILIERL